MARDSLGRDVAIALAAKMLALASLYLLFFAPHDGTPIDPAGVATHLLAPSPSAPASGVSP